MIRTLLDGAVAHAKDAITRASLVRRVATKTGLTKEVHAGGIKALVQARGKASASMMFRFHALNTPHRTALIHRERSFSFYELNEQMDRVAAGLAAAGLRKGDAVALMLKNVPEFLFCQAGVGRLGGSAVSMSWRSTAAELRYLIENSSARALVFDASVADVVREVLPTVDRHVGDRVYCVGGEVDGFATYQSLIETPAGGEVDYGDDLSDEGAVIIYTSGTTGKPKGAVRKFSRDAMIAVLSFIERTPMAYGQTHLTVCPLYHSTAFGFLSLSYILGATVVLLDGFEPTSFLDALDKYRVSHTAVVPTMLHRTLELGADQIAARDTSHLRAIFTGGAPLSGPLAKRVMGAFGDKLYNFYGATETGLVTLAGPHDLHAAPGTIGKCIGGNEIALFGEDGNICSDGEVGELFVRSGNLVEGYHANEGATRASMRDGFFSVGDLARRDALGYYFIEGRKRDMIISGGVNVYPREVEAVLAAHALVAEVAVIGVPDDEWGERVHAFVALHPDKSLSEADLLAHCRDALSGPKRPRGVTFMPSLPRNPTGKVLKRQLRESLESGAG